MTYALGLWVRSNPSLPCVACCWLCTCDACGVGADMCQFRMSYYAVLCAQYGVTRIVAGEMSGAEAGSLMMDETVACPAAWHKLIHAAPPAQAGTWSL